MSEKASMDLERFAGVIIETLRQLSSSRQPLSASFLSRALAKREEIVHLLKLQDPPTNSNPSGTPEENNDGNPASSRLTVLQSQKEDLLRQLALLEEKNAQTLTFCKRSLLTLANLHCGPGTAPNTGPLDKLKGLLMADTDLKELEVCINNLKDHMLQSASNGHGPKGSADGNFFGKWLKKKPSGKDREVSEEAELSQLRGAYLSILAEFHLDLGKDYLDRFSKLQKLIRETGDTGQLISLNAEVLSLIQTYITLMNEERNQVTDFIAEVGKGLIEMETNFVASLNHASEAHQSNVDFNFMLQGQMDEIKKSSSIVKTLSEIKGFVSSRLTSIKAALENKRQEDERRMEEINQEMGSLQQSLKTVRKEIEQVQEQSRNLERETLLDPLTGIPNRRAYDLRIREEFQRYHRYQQSFSLLLFDVDHFKRVNDSYGHWAGDKCLKEIIKRIKPVMRESDFVARYGGEEFVVILPATDRECAKAVAERLCRLIENTHFIFQGEKIPLTISVGVTHVEPSDQNQQTLFARVDAAMYQAKGSGRNQAVLA